MTNHKELKSEDIARLIDVSTVRTLHGGIRDLNTLAKMVAMRVARFGINVQASMDMIMACAELPGGVLRV